MNSIPRIIVASLFFIIFCSTYSFAWTSYTHTWICNRAGLSDLDCTNADNPKMQSTNPGINFKNHHCAEDSFTCAARVKAAEYLNINTTLARGFAAHLFADSMVPVHWYSLDYNTCHKIFEDSVEEKLRNSENLKYELFSSTYDFSSWNVSMQCPLKDGTIVNLYADDKYMDLTAKYVASEMHSGYVESPSKIYDITPIIYLFIAILLILFTLFFVMGMKNRKIRKDEDFKS